MLAVSVPSSPTFGNLNSEFHSADWETSMATDQEILEELRKMREAVTPKPAPPQLNQKAFSVNSWTSLAKPGSLDWLSASLWVRTSGK